MKKILGLDLGTNSIGWAVVETNNNGSPQNIIGMGSRIIPMGSDKIDYEKGAVITKNADRRAKRSARRMNKRYKMRRNKLLYILSKLNMLPEQFQFKDGFPEANKLQDLELLPISKKTLQLDSLEHYELRVNALSDKIELKELGSILYKYNRLRGYAGGGNDEEDEKKKKKDDDTEEEKKYVTYIQPFFIESVTKSDSTFKVKAGKDKGKELPVFNVVVRDADDNEFSGTTQLQILEDKVNKEFELEIRIKKTKKGDNITFALPQKTNWRKQMEETEKILKEKKYYPCQLFVEDLRKNKWTKIRNRVILRQQFMREFDAVWETQAKYYNFLNNCPQETLVEILNYIFPGQSDSQKQLREMGLKNGLKYIIRDQVIYYQRPLKSQSDLIGKCQYEKEEQVIPITHPLFQEFRCWDQINRLYITSKQSVWNEKKQKSVLQYTNRFLTDEQKMQIYDRLQTQKQLSFNEVAKIVELKVDNSEYLNGLHVKAKMTGCDTNIAIKKLIGDICNEDFSLENIWQAIYDNVHKGSEYDENSERVCYIQKALPTSIPQEKRVELALTLAQKTKFVRKYASLSKKAIENILPLMQLNPNNVAEHIKEQFNYIKHVGETGEVIDGNIPPDYMIDFVKDNPEALNKGGMMYAFAASLVYGRHTKEDITPQITNYHDIKYVERNLRNPIVEQILNETMQIVKSVWKQYKLNPNELEIRVELARDLKNSAQERDKIYKGQIKNQKINESIKKKLMELKQEVNDRNIELYKLWSKQEYPFDENGKEIARPKYADETSPTKDEIEKMRLWEEQHYVSPYTLKPIPLSKLFSSERLYDIDHIIPKSRYFDDSLTNKVVCESTINEEKNNRTAWEYISQQNSNLGICSVEDYLLHINKSFFGQKKKNLLAEKIPTNPVSRQMKDTQYISVAVKDELAKIVGSNNVKSTSGGVTDFLRSRWGLKKLFMELTESRFKQMELWDLNENGTPKHSWITRYFDKQKNRHIYEIKGWSKRFDHRHHAIDALVVALSNEKFIKRLNDLNKYFQEELAKHKDSIPMGDAESLEEAFFNLEKDKRDEIMKEIESSRKFDTPIENIVSIVKEYLQTMIVSQKPKDKLAIKRDNGNNQLKIRAALHQETYYGKTNGIDTKTINISNLKAKDIPQILDNKKNGLKHDIEEHKKQYQTMKEAFSGEGLIAFNETRALHHKTPVYKVKVWYSNKDNEESKLQRLYDDNPNKSVITGDNYLFVVMENKGKRVFDIASLYDSVAVAKEEIKNNNCNIDDIKNKICEAIRLQERKNKGKILPTPEKVLFYLQQNDLVYMPKSEDDNVLKFSLSELNDWLSDIENKKDFTQRIYRVVKFTGKDCFFIPNNYAKEISIPKDLTEEEKQKLKDKYQDKKIPKQELNYSEFSSFGNCVKVVPDKNFILSLRDKTIKTPKIQDYCVKLKTDWLGNIIEFNGKGI
ncbi:MAG: hypothetical protein IKR41_00715 [Bacteroidales bacterium]|nr:hypothetical protein [Bacteroidales bacterium]